MAGLLDQTFAPDDIEQPAPAGAPAKAFPNNGGMPGSMQGAMTGMTNTGVSTPQGGANLAGMTGDAWGGSPTMPRTNAMPGAEIGGFTGMGGPETGAAAPAAPTVDKTGAQPNQQADLGAFKTQMSSMLANVQAASGNPQAQAHASDELARTLSTQLSGAGHDVKWQGDTLMVDGRPYTVAGTNGQSTPAAPPPAPTDTGPYSLASTKAKAGIADPTLPPELANWMPSGSSYTPGDIGFGDIPEFTQDSLLGQMEGGPNGMATNSLVAQILGHPESMDAHTTDTMKAQMKDTLSEQQRQEEEDMQGFGAAAGIGDSPWMASQRLGSRRSRDMAVAKGNQDVDIQAAKQNQTDRLNAAGVGMQQGAQHASNVQASASAALSKSAVTGDRLQLRESVKQQAAQLGISADQVMSNFILDKEKSLIQKYGIDLGGQIDMEKLKLSDSQHKEDLVARMAELEKQLASNKEIAGMNIGAENGRFGQQMQLGYDQFNAGEDERDWQHDYLLSGGNS